MSKEEGRQVKQALLVEDHVIFREGLALLLSWRTDLDCVEAGSLAEGHRVLSDPKVRNGGYRREESNAPCSNLDSCCGHSYSLYG